MVLLLYTEVVTAAGIAFAGLKTQCGGEAIMVGQVDTLLSMAAAYP